MAIWSSSLLRIDAVARDTVGVHFRKPDGFLFKPGQTVTLTLPAKTPDSPALKHTFSLVSAPHEEDLSIATRNRKSPFKQALTRLQPDDPLSFSGPYGRFALPEQTGRPLVLIAGGIGITPYMSMLRDATHRGSTQKFLLLYSNHAPEQAAFLAELQELARLNPYFRLQATMTSDATQGWAGLRGRIDAAMLRQALQGLSEPLCYVTGTSAMVESISDLLDQIGIGDADVRSEGFPGY